MDSYDLWKLSPPPYYDKEPCILEYCAQCGRELVEGDEVYYDGNENYLCKDEKVCIKNFLIAHIDDFVDEIIDTMMQKVTLEVDEYEHDEY